MWKIGLWLTLAAWMFSISPAEAVTITRADLPTAYRNCQLRPCSVGTTSVFDFGAMNAFRVFERGPSGTEWNWLLRYSVYSTDPTTLSYMWLHVRGAYELSSSQHAVSLLVDQTALPRNSDWMNDDDPTDWDFVLTSDSLLSGTAQYASYCCSNQPGEYSLQPLVDRRYPTDGPLVPGGWLPCAADGCSATARLNFVYFMYELDPANAGTARLVFDPTRNESLLYSQVLDYTGFGGGEPYRLEHNFHVAPVPLPPAFALLIPALGVLSRFRRRSAR
jgi:hypothetical protein